MSSTTFDTHAQPNSSTVQSNRSPSACSEPDAVVLVTNSYGEAVDGVEMRSTMMGMSGLTVYRSSRR